MVQHCIVDCNSHLTACYNLDFVCADSTTCLATGCDQSAGIWCLNGHAGRPGSSIEWHHFTIDDFAQPDRHGPFEFIDLDDWKSYFIDDTCQPVDVANSTDYCGDTGDCSFVNLTNDDVLAVGATKWGICVTGDNAGSISNSGIWDMQCNTSVGISCDANNACRDGILSPSGFTARGLAAMQDATKIEICNGGWFTCEGFDSCDVATVEPKHYDGV